MYDLVANTSNNVFFSNYINNFVNNYNNNEVDRMIGTIIGGIICFKLGMMYQKRRE